MLSAPAAMEESPVCTLWATWDVPVFSYLLRPLFPKPESSSPFLWACRGHEGHDGCISLSSREGADVPTLSAAWLLELGPW